VAKAKAPTFNPATFAALSNAPSDTEAAAELLSIAARYLRAGLPLPRLLAEHFANAFERAKRVPARSRPAELARSLLLTASGRRPVANPIEVGSRVEALLIEGKSKTAAIAEVASHFACDISVVRRAWKTALDARDMSDGID
jgi:hypothetical protein